MCRICGCGDVNEYDEDLEDLAQDDPSLAYASQYLRDLEPDGFTLDRDRTEAGSAKIQDENIDKDVYTEEFVAFLEAQKAARKKRVWETNQMSLVKSPKLSYTDAELQELIEREIEHQKELEDRERESQIKRNELISTAQGLMEADFLAADKYFENECSLFTPVKTLRTFKRDFVHEWFKRYQQTVPYVKRFQFDKNLLDVIASVNHSFWVIAPPGCGKTIASVLRAVFLIRHCGVKPDEILFLTVNPSAAHEIRVQLFLALDPDAYEHWISATEEGSRQFRRTTPRTLSAAEILRELCDKLRVVLPHVFTFDSFAYALVESGKTRVIDEQLLSFRRTKVLQDTLISVFSDPRYAHIIRGIMMSRLQIDIESLFYARKYVTFAGNSVESATDKRITDLLVKHGVQYRYQRTVTEEKIPYIPHFVIPFPGEWKNNRGKSKKGIIVELSGSHYNSKVDETTQKKIIAWKKLKEYIFLLLDSRTLWDKNFEETFLSKLHSYGIETIQLSDDEIWSKIQIPAKNHLFALATQFLAHCQKNYISAADLYSLIEMRYWITESKGEFAQLMHDVLYFTEKQQEASGYLNFNQIQIEAQNMLKTGYGDFCAQHRSGDISSLRYVVADELHESSKQVQQTLSQISKINSGVVTCFLREPWQHESEYADFEKWYFNSDDDNDEEYTYYSDTATYYSDDDNDEDDTYDGDDDNDEDDTNYGDDDDYEGGTNDADDYEYTSTIQMLNNYRLPERLITLSNKLRIVNGESAQSVLKIPGEIEIGYWDQFEPTKLETSRHYEDSFIPALLRLIQHELCARDTNRITLLSRTHVISKSFASPITQSQQSTTKELQRQLRMYLPFSLRHRVIVTAIERFQGHEADCVILLDGVESRYPNVDTANQFLDVLRKYDFRNFDLERRLFYVACTRAAHKLIILTKTTEESAYIDDIRSEDDSPLIWENFRPLKLLSKEITIQVRAISKHSVHDTQSMIGSIEACGYTLTAEDPQQFVWTKTVQRDVRTIQTTKNEQWVIHAIDAEVSFRDEYGNRFALATITAGVWKLIEKDFSLLEAWGVDPLAANTEAPQSS